MFLLSPPMDMVAKASFYARTLSQLKWTNVELETLPKELIDVGSHCSREKADKNRNDTLFNAILERDGGFLIVMFCKYFDYQGNLGMELVR